MMAVKGEQGTVNSPASGVANIPVCLWLGGIREGYGLICAYLNCRLWTQSVDTVRIGKQGFTGFSPMITLNAVFCVA